MQLTPVLLNSTIYVLYCMHMWGQVLNLSKGWAKSDCLINKTSRILHQKHTDTILHFISHNYVKGLKDKKQFCIVNRLKHRVTIQKSQMIH